MGFSFKAKNPGLCKVNPEHKWEKDTILFWDKEKGIICCIDKCYSDQGGSAIVENNKNFKARKRLSAEEARAVSKQIWLYALENASEAFPKITTGTLDPTREFYRQNQLEQTARLFYQGIIDLMK